MGDVYSWNQIQFHLHLAFSLLTESISGPCLSVSVSGALTEVNDNKFQIQQLFVVQIRMLLNFLYRQFYKQNWGCIDIGFSFVSFNAITKSYRSINFNVMYNVFQQKYNTTIEGLKEKYLRLLSYSYINIYDINSKPKYQ